MKLSFRGIISYNGFEICVSLGHLLKDTGTPSQRYSCFMVRQWQLFVSDIQLDSAAGENTSLTTIMHIWSLLHNLKKKQT